MGYVTYGTNADGSKQYFNTTDGTVSFHEATPEEIEASMSITVSSTLVINSLEDEMAYYGFSPEEIENVMNKINGVSSLESNPKAVTITDPATGNVTINPNGSLLSNSAQSLKNTTEFQQATIEIEKQKLQAMNTQNEIQKKQLDMMDYNLIMQGQIFSQLAELNENLKAQTVAISNQTSKTIVNVDTSKLSEANVKIADSLEVQNQHYDFLKNGSDTLKDSNGNKIIPREVQAKINAEKLIEQEDTNKTTFDDIKDFVAETLGTVEDSLENALGNTDGFSLDFNPLSYIDEILMTDFIENKDNYYPENKA